MFKKSELPGYYEYVSVTSAIKLVSVSSNMPIKVLDKAIFILKQQTPILECNGRYSISIIQPACCGKGGLISTASPTVSLASVERGAYGSLGNQAPSSASGDSHVIMLAPLNLHE